MHVSGSASIPWALSGFGSGGRIFHAPLLASAAGLNLTAVVTRDAERRAAVAHAFPHALCVESMADLPGLGVVGVTISTPPATHLPLALEAIQLGLHVVVDKPFALSIADTRQIADAAQHAGVLAIPYFNRRLDDDFLTIRALVDGDRLGTVQRFESRLDRSRPVKPGWSSDAAQGGGLLLDLGPHLVDQALCLLGPVASVSAELDTVREGATSEDGVILNLFHISGARSVLFASLAAPAAGPRFLVQGSSGGARIEGFDVQEAQLKAGGSPASLGNAWGVDPNRCAHVFGLDGEFEEHRLEPGRWNIFYPAVAAALQNREAGNAEVPTGPADALATAVVLDAARTSAREDRAVTVSEAMPDIARTE
ncbi:MAG: Gfo/Idh/MocA family oxidoreductase [Nakamurella sp.]